jgi:hypothetical protein
MFFGCRLKTNYKNLISLLNFPSLLKIKKTSKSLHFLILNFDSSRSFANKKKGWAWPGPQSSLASNMLAIWSFLHTAVHDVLHLNSIIPSQRTHHWQCLSKVLFIATLNMAWLNYQGVRSVFKNLVPALRKSMQCKEGVSILVQFLGYPEAALNPGI